MWIAKSIWTQWTQLDRVFLFLYIYFQKSFKRNRQTMSNHVQPCPYGDMSPYLMVRRNLVFTALAVI